MFSPTTNLRLLSTPLESDYRNTLWFPNVTAQTAYFTSKTVKTYANFNYIKKDNTIVVPEEVDNLYNCNYIMYQNSNFGTRWFYAFINRMEWASNGSTRLYVSTDVIQTWFFDINYYQSYVDRCHSDTDTPGDNIVPEDFTDISHGGYHQVGTHDLAPREIFLYATCTPTGMPMSGQVLNGMYTGSAKVIGATTVNPEPMNEQLSNYVKQGTASAVSRIQQTTSQNGAIISFAKRPSYLACMSGTSQQAYYPTNKKLLSGAFITCYFQMYGQELEFNPEYINGANVQLKILDDGTSGSLGCMVSNYSNARISGLLVTTTIPESTWAYNQYKNDFNLHSGSNAIYNRRSSMTRSIQKDQAAAAVVSNAADAVSGTLNAFSAGSALRAIASSGGSLVSQANSIFQSGVGAYDAYKNLQIYNTGNDAISEDLKYINECYQAPAVGGVAASNVYLAGNETALSYGYKVPPLDIVKRCDKYLTVYGYKQSIYRNINLHARLNWTFIKTLGLNATGNFPDEDMKIIKSAFNNGIFFWSYTATFGNFDQPNPIV